MASQSSENHKQQVYAGTQGCVPPPRFCVYPVSLDFNFCVVCVPHCRASCSFTPSSALVLLVVFISLTSCPLCTAQWRVTDSGQGTRWRLEVIDTGWQVNDGDWGQPMAVGSDQRRLAGKRRRLEANQRPWAALTGGGLHMYKRCEHTMAPVP